MNAYVAAARLGRGEMLDFLLPVEPKSAANLTVWR